MDDTQPSEKEEKKIPLTRCPPPSPETEKESLSSETKRIGGKTTKVDSHRRTPLKRNSKSRKSPPPPSRNRLYTSTTWPVMKRSWGILKRLSNRCAFLLRWTKSFGKQPRPTPIWRTIGFICTINRTQIRSDPHEVYTFSEVIKGGISHFYIYGARIRPPSAQTDQIIELALSLSATKLDH